MKKLNITKKQFGESKYFTQKYGTLKYVSESGKIYKTDKGHLLKFKESVLGESNDENAGCYYIQFKNGRGKSINILDDDDFGDINEYLDEKTDTFKIGWGNDEDGYMEIVRVFDQTGPGDSCVKLPSVKQWWDEIDDHRNDDEEMTESESNTKILLDPYFSDSFDVESLSVSDQEDLLNAIYEELNNVEDEYRKRMGRKQSRSSFNKDIRDRKMKLDILNQNRERLEFLLDDGGNAGEGFQFE